MPSKPSTSYVSVSNSDLEGISDEDLIGGVLVLRRRFWANRRTLINHEESVVPGEGPMTELTTPDLKALASTKMWRALGPPTL
jgi:hypothetical protein